MGVGNFFLVRTLRGRGQIRGLQTGRGAVREGGDIGITIVHEVKGSAGDRCRALGVSHTYPNAHSGPLTGQGLYSNFVTFKCGAVFTLGRG